MSAHNASLGLDVLGVDSASVGLAKALRLAALQRELPSLEPVLLREVTREVVEGTGHTGVAEVVQFVGRRPR